MSNFATKLVNNPKMEEVIAIIVTILGSAIYAYLESAHKKHKERKAPVQRTSAPADTATTLHAMPLIPSAEKKAPTIPTLPEEGVRITAETPEEPEIMVSHSDTHHSAERIKQLQRWRRALIDREILTPKYH